MSKHHTYHTCHMCNYYQKLKTPLHLCIYMNNFWNTDMKYLSLSLEKQNERGK